MSEITITEQVNLAFVLLPEEYDRVAEQVTLQTRLEREDALREIKKWHVPGLKNLIWDAVACDDEPRISFLNEIAHGCALRGLYRRLARKAS